MTLLPVTQHDCISLTCCLVDNCDITGKASYESFSVSGRIQSFTGNSLAPISTVKKTPDESKIKSHSESFLPFIPSHLWNSGFPVSYWVHTGFLFFAERQSSKSLHHFLLSFLLLGEHCECQSTRLLSSSLINLWLSTGDCPN